MEKTPQHLISEKNPVVEEEQKYLLCNSIALNFIFCLSATMKKFNSCYVV